MLLVQISVANFFLVSLCGEMVCDSCAVQQSNPGKAEDRPDNSKRDNRRHA